MALPGRPFGPGRWKAPRYQLDCRKTLEAVMAQFIPIVLGFVVCIAAALMLALSSKSNELGP